MVSGDVIQAHAKAIMIGLQFALDAGFMRLEVEDYCQDLLNLVRMSMP